MLPLAPGLLSTITGWPSRPLPMSAAIMRATVSRIPPGATGTTSVTGRDGNPWAPGPAETSMPSAAATSAMDFLMSYPPCVNTSNSVRAVILDLDGTLIDTAGEIVAAANRTLEELGLATLPPPAIEALIGRGVPSLVERALAQVEGGALIQLDRAVERFEAHYSRTVGTDARLFPGVMPGLRRFAEAGIAMSVVTNKPRFFTEMLLERCEVAAFFKAVVTGDDGIPRKTKGDMFLAEC